MNKLLFRRHLEFIEKQNDKRKDRLYALVERLDAATTQSEIKLVLRDVIKEML